MSLIPPPDPFGTPASPWIFVALYHLTFVAHVVLMNFVAGGSIAMLYLRIFPGKDDFRTSLARAMRDVFPVVLSLAVTAGIGPLLFVQLLYGNFFYTANILLGIFWWVVFMVVMALFALTYLQKGLEGRRPAARRGACLLATLAAIGTLYVAWILTNNAVLVQTPTAWADFAFGGNGAPYVQSAILAPRLAHNLVGAIAVTGVWIAMIGYYKDLGECRTRAVTLGLRTTLFATLAQAGIGLWYLFSTEAPFRALLLGQDSTTSIIWIAAIILTVFLLGTAILGIKQPTRRAWGWVSTALVVLILFGMSGARFAMRWQALEEHFTPDQLVLNWQVSPLVMFAGTLLVGIATLVVMTRWLWVSRPS